MAESTICQSCYEGAHADCTAYHDVDPTRKQCECDNPDHVGIGLENAKQNALKTSSGPMIDVPDIEYEAEKTRSRILKTADELINGDREHIYGPPEVNFGNIANLLNAMGYKHQDWKGDSRGLNATDVAIIMAQVKMSRLNTTPSHEDTWIDAVGYLALGAETALPKPADPSYLKGIQLNTAGAILFEVFKRATRTKEMVVRCREDMEQLPFSKIQEHMSEKHPDTDKYLAPSS